MILLMIPLPGNLHFASTKAAMEATMHCATVTTTVTNTLFHTYREKGTHICPRTRNISRKLSRVGFMG